MKHLLLCATILIRTFAMAGNTDSTFHRHTFSISMANGISQQFFDGPGSRPATGWRINTPYSPGEFSPNYRVNFTPMYAAHIQVHYSLGLSSFVRLETGVGYLLSGSTCSYSLSGFIAGSNPNHYYTFSGAITLPIYIQFIKPMRHGAFTCTLGPDFDLPVHTFYYNPSGMILDEQELTLGHRHYSTTETVQLSTMGFYLKLGYEKRLRASHPMSINIGPVIDFDQLVSFHHQEVHWQLYPPDGYYPYQFYTGVDVSLSFGMKK